MCCDCTKNVTPRSSFVSLLKNQLAVNTDTLDMSSMLYKQQLMRCWVTLCMQIPTVARMCIQLPDFVVDPTAPAMLKRVEIGALGIVINSGTLNN